MLWLWRKYGCSLWQITQVKCGAEGRSSAESCQDNKKKKAFQKDCHRHATHCVIYYNIVAFVRLIWFCFLPAVWAATSRSLKHWRFVASVTARSNESPGRVLPLGNLSCLNRCVAISSANAAEVYYDVWMVCKPKHGLLERAGLTTRL